MGYDVLFLRQRLFTCYFAMHNQPKRSNHNPSCWAFPQPETYAQIIIIIIIIITIIITIIIIIGVFTKGSLGYLSSMYFSTCGRICLHSLIFCCYVLFFGYGKGLASEHIYIYIYIDHSPYPPARFGSSSKVLRVTSRL